MFAALHEQNRELLTSLLELHRRRDESVQLNRELSDTNRGVVALYAELEENAEQLRQASELKTRFLSNMSHEFRTPLNSILALSRLLMDRIDGDLGAEQEKQVGYIRRAAQDLLELVNDLLDLAKVEAGKTELKPAAFHVDELFGALRGALKPLQANPDVELLFESDSGLPPLFTDEAKLGQILRNLVSNALKFTEAGTVRVSAAATPDKKRMVFSVRDTGIGIAPQDHDLIFEQFTQIDTTLQRHVKGTGLGLPLSRKLATLLGGDISLESLPGQGSCFSLDIAVDVRETPRKCLLVIDDDQTFRYVFRQMIAAEMPYDVIEAVDGADGLKRAREDMPALIILDLQMPRMDGFAVLREIRNDARLQRMPVVISTSLPLTPEMKARLPAGQRLLPKDELSRENLTALLRETFMEDAAV
jgi:signal transduction histidine kinase